MKRLAAILFALLCLGSVSWAGVPHGTSFVATNFFISPTGNDANACTQGSPCLTTGLGGKTIHCGDVITAAAGTYASSSFDRNWGTVTSCPSSNGLYFAALQCAGPDIESCVIADTTSNGMWVNKSNWAISGWRASSTVGICFVAEATPSGVIHHVAFINVIAANCAQAGVQSLNGIDQFAAVGVLAYNASTTAAFNASPVTTFQPTNFDNSPGTHIFYAGIIAWHNIDGTNPSTDGGILFDHFGVNSYTGQAVMEQNLSIGNGEYGISACCSNSGAPVFFFNNTSYGNYQDGKSQFGGGEGAFTNFTGTSTLSVTNNIFQATLASNNAQTVYGVQVGTCGANCTVSGNYILGIGGNNTNSFSSPGFSFGTNTLSDSGMASPTVPGAPSCTGKVLTTTCMATTIANYKPSGGAVAFGYQPPGACTPDAFYPTWLKGVVPNGLVTKPCGM